ncbi:MAG: AraC family transcriptional regulator, partial [Dehalococcoidales bacterium]|nr:AraC family transcriptional regulator [Dehalococcoidales bacterium]
MKQHLGDPISLNALAKIAGYSPWHAARTFKELTGKAPFEYIRARRMTQAASKLQQGGVRIVDVALDFVFESHEGFTRAFTREFGVSPYIYSMNKPPLKLFMPPGVRDIYLNKKQGEPEMPAKNKQNTVIIQVIDRPARKLILKRGSKATNYFEYCEETGCDEGNINDVWRLLSGIKEALYEPIGMWLPENLRNHGTSIYCQGVEVAKGFKGKLPAGFEIIDLPPCKMMIFQGQPYDDDNFEEAISNLWEVMKTFDPKLYGFEWADEDGPRFQLEPMGYRGYIEARPVR